MCCPDPLLAFDIAPSRVDKALSIIASLKEQLSTEDAIDVAFEMGLGDVVTYTLDQKLVIDFHSDIQIVAYAAACVAAAECKARKKVNR